MAVAGLSFEELELDLSSPSSLLLLLLLLLLLFLAAFWFFSPVLLDFSLLVLFLPAIGAWILVEYVRGMLYVCIDLVFFSRMII